MVSVGEPRPLLREDLDILRKPAFVAHLPAEKLRAQHHRIARLAASGLRQFEIADLTGYNPNRISILLNSPAMRELVARYSEVVDAAWERSLDGFHDRATRNMKIAEDLIGARLERAEEEGIDLPLRDLVAISGDRADRFGYPRKQINDNRNTNFAELLEKMNERAKQEKTIDATPSSP